MSIATSSKAVIALAVVISLGGCATGERPAVSALPEAAESNVPPERLIATGNALLDKEQYQEAMQLFVQALQRDPERVEAKLGIAESYLGSGSLQMALAGFTELTEVLAVRITAMQGAGISLLRLGQTEKAQAMLTTVVGDAPSSWRAWNALGRCYDMQERWADAGNAYRRALAARPDSYAVHNNLGMSLLSQSRHAEAEQEFLAALSARPDFDVARNNLRFALALQGKYRDAFAGAQRQDMPTVLNNIGYAALLRGERDRAKAYFSRAMEASPHFFEIAYENLQRTKDSTDQAE